MENKVAQAVSFGDIAIESLLLSKSIPLQIESKCLLIKSHPTNL